MLVVEAQSHNNVIHREPADPARRTISIFVFVYEDDRTGGFVVQEGLSYRRVCRTRGLVVPYRKVCRAGGFVVQEGLSYKKVCHTRGFVVQEGLSKKITEIDALTALKKKYINIVRRGGVKIIIFVHLEPKCRFVAIFCICVWQIHTKSPWCNPGFF